MKIGLSLPQAGVNATRENVIKFAQAAEKENFDSLWVLERLLYPINPQTKYPGSTDGMMPEEWKNIYDPINLLSFVAANTNKILLGTGVIDVLFHNPVVLGREFATLDVLSQGRTIAGLGIGWLKDEYQTSNVPFERRGARQDEFIQAMKRVWTDDVVEFHEDWTKTCAKTSSKNLAWWIFTKDISKNCKICKWVAWSSRCLNRTARTDHSSNKTRSRKSWKES